MSWLPQQLGAEPKKVLVLVGIVVLGGGLVYYVNSDSGPAVPTPSQPKAAIPSPATQPRTPTPQARPTSTPSRPGGPRSRGSTDEFKPSYNLPDGFDLTKVDPMLQTDKLASLRQLGDVGGKRSLFEFYVPPPPPPPPQPKIIPTVTPPPPPPPPVVTQAPKPLPPPPIPLKYVGYEGSPQKGRLRGIFKDPNGDDVFLRISEDKELIRNRFRVVRVAAKSADVEDTVAKNTQTLSIEVECETKDGGCK